MKVLLISTGLVGLGQSMPDLGLGYIATYLRNKGHDVHFLDFSCDKYKYDIFDNYLKKHNFMLVGIKVFSSGLEFCNKIINQIKHINNNTRVIVGGPHPSCDPEHSLTYFSKADFACIGEGERCMAMLASNIENKNYCFQKIPGLAYRCDSISNGIIKNDRLYEMDLDKLGIPAWDLMPPKKYSRYRGLYLFPRKDVVAPISVSRGCPYNCAFCTGHTITGRKNRFRSVDLVLDEIEILMKKYGVQEIHIIDDWFTANKNYVMDFCAKIRERKLTFQWACPYGIRVDSITEELIKSMSNAGCYMVALGIESANQRILNLMRKKLDVSIVRDKIDIIKKCSDIIINGFFMIGYPTETEDEINHTIKFASALAIDLATFTSLRLTPGAEVLELVKADGWYDFVWEDVSNENISYYPSALGHGKLKNLRRKAFIEFFIKPKRIVYLLRVLTSKKNINTFLSIVKRRMFQ
jgi:anaerobic magnesium-protoporphyrin IX monomethyl ester cyclase